jgi:Holliday junction resolvase RusA-like endonuclease
VGAFSPLHLGAAVGGMVEQMDSVTLTIYGECVSMKNSRQKTSWGGIIKSDKARQYESDIIAQVKTLPKLLEGELSVTMHLYYTTQRPDLDGDLILDCLQGRIYQNDRQVREKHLFHGIDKVNPRAEIEIKKRSVENVGRPQGI